MGTARFETLVDYAKREVDVGIRCEGCRRVRYMTVAQLGDVFGLATRRDAIERRLRCSQCGHKGARLAPIPRLE